MRIKDYIYAKRLVENIGLLGDFSKDFVIMTVAIWVFVIIEFVYMKQVVAALLLLFVLMISLSMITYEYSKYRKKKTKSP